MTIDEFPLFMQLVIVVFIVLFSIETIAGYFYTSTKNKGAKSLKAITVTKWPVTILLAVLTIYSVYVQEWGMTLIAIILLVGRFYWDRKFIKNQK